MTTISVSNAQKNISEIFSWKNSSDPVRVTSHWKTKGYFVSPEQFEELKRTREYLESWMISFIEPWTEDYFDILEAIEENKKAYARWEGYVDADEFMKSLKSE